MPKESVHAKDRSKARTDLGVAAIVGKWKSRVEEQVCRLIALSCLAANFRLSRTLLHNPQQPKKFRIRAFWTQKDYS